MNRRTIRLSEVILLVLEGNYLGTKRSHCLIIDYQVWYTLFIACGSICSVCVDLGTCHGQYFSSNVAWCEQSDLPSVYNQCYAYSVL